MEQGGFFPRRGEVPRGWVLTASYLTGKSAPGACVKVLPLAPASVPPFNDYGYDVSVNLLRTPMPICN